MYIQLNFLISLYINRLTFSDEVFLFRVGHHSQSEILQRWFLNFSPFKIIVGRPNLTVKKVKLKVLLDLQSTIDLQLYNNLRAQGRGHMLF